MEGLHKLGKTHLPLGIRLSMTSDVLLESLMCLKYPVIAGQQITVARPLVVGVTIGSDRSRRKSNRTCVFHRTCGYMFGQFKLRDKDFGAKRASGCHGGWGKKSKRNDQPTHYIYIF
jgi:hypothetical protein